MRRRSTEPIRSPWRTPSRESGRCFSAAMARRSWTSNAIEAPGTRPPRQRLPHEGGDRALVGLRSHRFVRQSAHRGGRRYERRHRGDEGRSRRDDAAHHSGRGRPGDRPDRRHKGVPRPHRPADVFQRRDPGSIQARSDRRRPRYEFEDRSSAGKPILEAIEYVRTVADDGRRLGPAPTPSHIFPACRFAIRRLNDGLCDQIRSLASRTWRIGKEAASACRNPASGSRRCAPSRCAMAFSRRSSIIC